MYYFIPDPVTATLKMQAGEADLYFGTAINDQLTLQKAGLTRIVGQPTVWCLYPNIVNPESKWLNKDLREAIEYALDKEGIASAFGFGYAKAAKMFVPQGAWGYSDSWAGRSYDVAKAKELVEKSGYAGATVKVMVLTGTMVDTRMVNKYNFFVLEVVKAWIDPTMKNPRTLHHQGKGVFMVAGDTIKLPSRMK